MDSFTLKERVKAVIRTEAADSDLKDVLNFNDLLQAEVI